MAEFVDLLQVERDFRPCSEPVSEAQRRISGDGAMAVQNLGHAIDWDVALVGEFGRAHVPVRVVLRRGVRRGGWVRGA